MTMSPSTYLTKRRTAAGLTIEDVAAQIKAEPPMSELERTDWLRRIESGAAPISRDVLDVLGRIFDFDLEVLEDLIELQKPEPAIIAAPQLCEVCACSEYDPCEAPAGRYCSWATPTLCSSCKVREAQAAVA